MKISIVVDEARLPRHTREQLREWLRFKLGVMGSMAVDNPLADCDLEQCVVGAEI